MKLVILSHFHDWTNFLILPEVYFTKYDYLAVRPLSYLVNTLLLISENLFTHEIKRDGMTTFMDFMLRRKSFENEAESDSAISRPLKELMAATNHKNIKKCESKQHLTQSSQQLTHSSMAYDVISFQLFFAIVQWFSPLFSSSFHCSVWLFS